MKAVIASVLLTATVLFAPASFAAEQTITLSVHVLR